MSETVKFCTQVASFCGFGCDTVDFVGLDDPNNPRRETCCDCIPRFWFFFEKLLLLVDMANLIFDIAFIGKLNSQGEGSWAKVLLSATLTTFIGTLMVGKAVLYNIKTFSTTKFVDIVYKEPVYYGFWGLTEVSAFLLEDASTLYLYFSVNGSFDYSHVLDVGNVYMSLASGMLSLLALLLMTCTVYARSPQKCLSNLVLFGLAGLFVAYPTYLTFYYLLPGRTDDENIEDENIDREFPIVALVASSFFGYVFFLYIAFALVCQKSCAEDFIEWPTENGMVRQRHLEVRQHTYGGIGSPTNTVKGNGQGCEQP